MKTTKTKSKDGSISRVCDCFAQEPTRRDFLARTACGLAAVLVASGISPEIAHALPVAFTRADSFQGTERSYPIPSGDGVNIDPENEVIIVRQGNRMYAFSLACPHENTALRWRQDDLRFQCPRHESKYQPDGTFISGRATRNMDRFAVRRDGQKVVVDLSKMFRSDQQKSDWDAAVLVL